AGRHGRRQSAGDGAAPARHRSVRARGAGVPRAPLRRAVPASRRRRAGRPAAGRRGPDSPRADGGRRPGAGRWFPRGTFVSASGFVVGERRIGGGAPVFVVAEAGVNHNGDVALALSLVDAAADGGADAVKFQTFRTDALVSRAAPKAGYQVETTGGAESQRDMLARLELTLADFARVQERCAKRGVVFFSAPFDEAVGLSDHTLGLEVALAAVARGAAIVEKHLTLDKAMPGPDHRASLDPGEMAALVRGIRTVESALGDGDKRPTPSELDTRRV